MGFLHRFMDVLGFDGRTVPLALEAPLPPEDAQLDPIRAAVISGRTLVVVTKGGVLPHLVEALRICGRLDDTTIVETRDDCDRLVWSGFGDEEMPAREFVQSGLVSFVRHETNKLRRNSINLGIAPVTSLREAVGPGRVLVMVEGDKGLSNNFQRVLDKVMEGAGSIGVAPPLIFDDMAWIATPGGMVAKVSRFPGQASLRLIGEKDAVEAILAPAAAGARTWRAAVRRFDEGLEILGNGREAWIRQGDRLVLVRHKGRTAEEGGQHPDQDWYEIFDAARGRLPTMSNAPHEFFDRDRLLRLLVLAWRGARTWKPSRRTFDDPVRSLCQGNGSLGPSAGAREALAMFDVDLALAMPSGDLRTMVYHLVASASPAESERRRQFVMTWPACHEALLRPRIRDGVDAGRKGTGLVAGFLGAEPFVARRMVGVSAKEFGAEVSKALRFGMPGVGGVLTQVGHGMLPRRGALFEWKSLGCTFKKVESLFTELRLLFAEPTLGVALACGLPGNDWRERLMAVDPLDPASACDVTRSLRDWLTALTGERIGIETALLMLVGRSRSLMRLIEACDAWHGDRILMDGIIAPTGYLRTHMLGGQGAWPVPFRRIDLGDGWSAHMPATQSELSEEGLEMAHCVENYALSCLSGRSLIVSLRHEREGRNKRVSTAEIVPGAGDWRLSDRTYTLRQHRSFANGAPPQEAVRMLERLREMLADGKVPLDETALAERPMAERIVVRRHGRRDALAQIPERGLALPLHPAWARVLPAPYGAMDVEELTRAVLALEREPVPGRRAAVRYGAAGDEIFG